LVEPQQANHRPDEGLNELPDNWWPTAPAITDPKGPAADGRRVRAGSWVRASMRKRLKAQTERQTSSPVCDEVAS
jgi:hypothetical protein